MLRSVVRRLFTAGEVESRTGRALVEERYSTLRRQIPIIYMLAAVNLFGLQLASSGTVEIGLNVPSAVAACAAIRIIQWLRVKENVPHRQMLRRMHQTILLATVICLSVFLWCFDLLRTETTESQMAVMLFGGLTAIGVTYGLSPVPAAARVPLLTLVLPLALFGLWSNDPQFVGASLSLSFVSLLLLRLLVVNNSHFTALVQSRSIIAREQELAEIARQEAIVAATTDFLTGLPNRRAFVAALASSFEEAGESGRFAVGILDLDRFKAINDTFGHASGDKLLSTVAKRLRSAAGKSVVVARLGGDEFGLLIPCVSTGAQAERVARAILESVNRPTRVDGRQFTVSLCCGLALAGARNERTPSRLLADADLALYEAKEQAEDKVAVFDSWMEAPRSRRVLIERALEMPGVQDRIELVYQPIFELPTGRIIANEALARWSDPELGNVPPAEFVPIAEQLNVIGKLTKHLLAKAFADAAEWPASVRLSFNLSAVDLCAADTADIVLEALGRAALPTGRLQVEVTETALLRDFNRAKDNLERLGDAGVTVVLDDFGAGYASIAYLKQLRFDIIKIDGGLLTAALDSADGERLLGAVLGLCGTLGVEAVAEHVEHEEQLKLLIRLGCRAGQGFWLQRPLPADECLRFANGATLVAEDGAGSAPATEVAIARLSTQSRH